MKLGILSDSHAGPAGPPGPPSTGGGGGRGLRPLRRPRRAEVIDELAGRRCWFVWGNTDDRNPNIRSYVETLGLPWPDGPLELSLDGKRIAVFHGHEAAFRRAVQAPGHDYLFYGHTHPPGRTGGSAT